MFGIIVIRPCVHVLTRHMNVTTWVVKSAVQLKMTYLDLNVNEI